MAGRVPFQTSLFGGASDASGADDTQPSFDATFAGARRIALDASAWIDVLPGWLRGADALMTELVATRRWGSGRSVIPARVRA